MKIEKSKTPVHANYKLLEYKRQKYRSRAYY